MLAALIDGMNDGSRHRRRRRGRRAARPTNGDGGVTATARTCRRVLGIIELCWGDVGLLLSMPRQGLGNSAIASVADEEQLERFAGKWAAMAITEPEAGSDSAAIRTTAVLGRRRVRAQRREDLRHLRRARRSRRRVGHARPRPGRAAIKSFVVERSNPGLKLERLEHKLGIRASDTAAFRLEDCRVPARRTCSATPTIDIEQGFGGVMQTFDNTRPLVAGMAVGLARACLEETRRLLDAAGVEIDWDAAPAPPVRRGRAPTWPWRPTTRPRAC